MPETIIGPEQRDRDEDSDFDDIESELNCSAREACVTYLPFVNLDLMRAAMEYAQIRAATGRVSDNVNPTH
jgi:hypothetical protein